ncbi:TetR/AcrR family transcriptional regulator [Pseudonocardia spinosispora]|uniref:TetR/AcrR family transcriptional regulator n=1 Tax=Pseudonocardia spinosispora TaxID=103441 RepID=UPI0003F7F55E|nr:TetR/AcrR family transcriptional regulator [Pseudonocardia spinosispora]
MTTRPELSDRRSPGRPPVPLERIIATAIQILDEEGADALSMRTLARRLNSGTATLYRHFSGRAELVAHVIDGVLGEGRVEPEVMRTLSWSQACETLAHAMFEVFRRHPGVAPLLVDQVPVGPHAMAQREQGIALLLDAGFSPADAAQTWATLARYVLGFAIQLAGGGSEAGEPWAAPDMSAFPATLSVVEHLPIPLEREFAFGLNLLIGGLGRLRGHD